MAVPTLRPNSSGFGDEEIKGYLSCVRIEKRDLTASHSNRRLVQSTTYRPDGSISYRDVYDYSAEGGLDFVRTLDGNGAERQRVKFVGSIKSGVHVAIIMSPDGIERQRTITKRDAAGRVLESTIAGSTGETLYHLKIESADQDRRVKARLTSEHQPELNGDFEFIQQPDAQIEQPMPSATVNEGGLNRDILPLITSQMSGQNVRTVERIDAIDGKGNWTKKTILRQDTVTQISVPIEEVYRTITYR